MKNIIRRTLALALTLAMLMTAIPMEALAAIKTVSGSVSIGALMGIKGVSPDDKSYKLSFVLEGAEKSEWTQIVTADSPAARQPDAPVRSIINLTAGSTRQKAAPDSRHGTMPSVHCPPM